MGGSVSLNSDANTPRLGSLFQSQTKVSGANTCHSIDFSLVPSKSHGNLNIQSHDYKHQVQFHNLKKEKWCKVYQNLSFPQSTIVSANNGLVDSVIKACEDHLFLLIRAEDVWISIMTQFSYYINANAEQFRKEFVNFEGKMELVASEGVTEMVELIHKNLVDPELIGWILPNFANTSEDEVITLGIVCMAIMKNYFNYTFTFGGFPCSSSRPQRMLTDFKEIQSRLEKLDQYNLQVWNRMLKSVVDQLVKSRSGTAHPAFWKKICHYVGSGPVPKYLSGWITAFCLFDKNGTHCYKNKLRPLLERNNIPSGVVEVDVEVNNDGEEFKAIMSAGAVGMEIGPFGQTILSRSGWSIASQL